MSKNIEYDEYVEYDPSLNIIGSYKLSKCNCISPVSCMVKINQNVIDRPNQRDDGFSLLSNRENVVQYLKKTKFCKILIDKGVCSREVCNFAHSMSEMVFPNCAFHLNCHKKDKCMFKHPHETLVEYKDRIQFKIPPNILVC
jgi:hypothetical protein